MFFFLGFPRNPRIRGSVPRRCPSMHRTSQDWCNRLCDAESMFGRFRNGPPPISGQLKKRKLKNTHCDVSAEAETEDVRTFASRGLFAPLKKLNPRVQKMGLCFDTSKNPSPCVILVRACRTLAHHTRPAIALRRLLTPIAKRSQGARHAWSRHPIASQKPALPAWDGTGVSHMRVFEPVCFQGPNFSPALNSILKLKPLQGSRNQLE